MHRHLILDREASQARHKMDAPGVKIALRSVVSPVEAEKAQGFQIWERRMNLRFSILIWGSGRDTAPLSLGSWGKRVRVRLRLGLRGRREQTTKERNS